MDNDPALVSVSSKMKEINSCHNEKDPLVKSLQDKFDQVAHFRDNNHQTGIDNDEEEMYIAIEELDKQGVANKPGKKISIIQNLES